MTEDLNLSFNRKNYLSEKKFYLSQEEILELAVKVVVHTNIEFPFFVVESLFFYKVLRKLKMKKMLKMYRLLCVIINLHPYLRKIYFKNSRFFKILIIKDLAAFN